MDDPQLIQHYEYWHKRENSWPEIKKSIVAAGITQMEIYRTGNGLFMIMETYATLFFEKKANMDATSPKVQEMEELMWNFQKPLSWAKEGEKWIILNKIFELNNSIN